MHANEIMARAASTQMLEQLAAYTGVRTSLRRSNACASCDTCGNFLRANQGWFHAIALRHEMHQLLNHLCRRSIRCISMVGWTCKAGRMVAVIQGPWLKVRELNHIPRSDSSRRRRAFFRESSEVARKHVAVQKRIGCTW
jgi:hypothetical protein